MAGTRCGRILRRPAFAVSEVPIPLVFLQSVGDVVESGRGENYSGWPSRPIAVRVSKLAGEVDKTLRPRMTDDEDIWVSQAHWRRPYLSRLFPALCIEIALGGAIVERER